MSKREEDIKALGDLLQEAGFNGGVRYSDGTLAGMVNNDRALTLHGYTAEGKPSHVVDYQRIVIQRYYAAGRNASQVELADIRATIDLFPVRRAALIKKELVELRAENAKLRAEIQQMKAEHRAKPASAWSWLKGTRS